MCVWVCVLECGCQLRSKVVSDHLDLEVQVVVSCLTQVMGTKLRSPGKAASALNHRALDQRVITVQSSAEGHPGWSYSLASLSSAAMNKRASLW